jgi:hypothetical protein
LHQDCEYVFALPRWPLRQPPVTAPVWLRPPLSFPFASTAAAGKQLSES